MAKTRITASDLETNCSARFYVLPKALTTVFVKGFFAKIIQQHQAKQVAPAEVRVTHGKGSDSFVHSFLCYGWRSPVTFLKTCELYEQHYGFVLLIERSGHLAVFYKGGGGFDKVLSKVTRSIARNKLTHAWAEEARYKKMGTRRMTISRQELRGASYDADDLETAVPPAIAGRSIPQSLRLHAEGFGTVAITPSTGRVQKTGGKGMFTELVGFMDDTIEQINKKQISAFLQAFPSPLELWELPDTVYPTALLIDLAALHDEIMAVGTNLTLKYTGDSAMDEEALCKILSQLRLLVVNADQDWVSPAEKEGEVFAKVSRLKHVYKVNVDYLSVWSVHDDVGQSQTLDQWIRENNAFSLTFSEPDYFYTSGHLYQRAGFRAEATQVLKLLKIYAKLDGAESEKGPKSPDTKYPADAVVFTEESIFRLVETSLASGDTHLCCCDLGDEWADYLGFGPNGVTFYHCKDGSPTTGASDFQIVIGQALKNLSRVQFRTDEVRKKLESRREKGTWGTTQIPLLVRPAGDWDGLISAGVMAASAPDSVWNIALVVTALSRADFERELAKTHPKPSFIQLVWLLSAFASGCAERGAKPVVFCRT